MDATVITARHVYDVVYDRTFGTRVFVTGAIVDDADGRAISPPLRILVDEPLLRGSAHARGLALAGDPEVALTDIAVAHALAVTVEGEGYRPATQIVTIPINPIFPVDAPVALRRMPVRLTGRVSALATGAPVDGARLAITGPALPAPRKATLLAQPLAADVTPGGAFQGHAIAAVGSPVPVKTVQLAADAGSLEVLVDNRQGLGAGQLLRFGAIERAHWAEIAAVSAVPANLALPGMVTLTAPLVRSVRLGDAAAPFALGAPAGPNCLPVGPAFAGEAVLILDDVPGGDVIAIADPPAPARYATAGAVTGPLGDYAVDGFCRIGTPVLSVAATGFTTQSRTIPMPRPPTQAATLDWRLKP
jgi:hypothetical protein